MEAYQILKLNNEPFDFLVIATSYENPLSHIDEISKEIKAEHAKILFDLTLINGTKSNRYISCDFRLGESYLQSCSVVKEIDVCIKNISHNYFAQNHDVVQNSVVPNSLKFLLKSGMI
ncbi:type II toxin-antitoxin system RnlB family antitoxin [Faecalispora anaeroviscerum]|uniref:type II toxin-antitoxin system RnlB family antitoxin n=1 Tax=Faecalispora anaeroviscerum TaxID=2991836 RepID=UPI0024B9C40D|nr:type II toxin-antitoxin system RnlB family antitoxin [Faecalispora anaeroviscerum]